MQGQEGEGTGKVEENIKLGLRGSRIGGRLGWGRAGGVEHLCPMPSHVQLPGDRTGSRETLSLHAQLT